MKIISLPLDKANSSREGDEMRTAITMPSLLFSVPAIERGKFKPKSFQVGVH